jgi:spermidine/putrescine transport system ATP-binding protein
MTSERLQARPLPTVLEQRAAAAVELHGVVKRFDDVVAVDRVELAIADGEFFSLLGASGCGKTTTLRMIGGLEFPTAGSIRIFGEEMGLRPANRRPVNTVFQSYALFPHMTVEANVAFGLEMRGVDRATVRRRVGEALDLVHLSGLGARKPKQLSGGQQQRVALARALVNEPKVLLLDEPLGALDLKLRQAMQRELKQIQQRVGITFVYVTHDQEEALTMSDRIGVMDAGRLVQVGTPEEIYERPETRMEADFIGETNFLDAAVDEAGWLRLADGRRIRAATGDAAPGTHATVTVRPERMLVVGPADPQPRETNQLEGTVTGRVYLGNALTFDVDLGVAIVRVRQANDLNGRRVDVGGRVAVRWHAAAGSVLEG